MKFDLLKYCNQSKDLLEERIEKGIRENRMGSMKIEFLDREGKPLDHIEAKVRQISHAFKFGCNIFMLDGFEEEWKNRNYEESFQKLFNLAIVPFYWSTLEPEPGKLRFFSDSEKIFRRPAPDSVLDFCKSRGIEAKGHTLIWQQMYPEWLPGDQDQVELYIRKRFREIAQRYKEQIESWDVVNEALQRYRHHHVVLAKDNTCKCFQIAKELFTQNRLFLNEATDFSFEFFNYEDSPYYLLIKNLLDRGTKLDGIGKQFHLFFTKEELYKKAETLLNPVFLSQVLDQYGEFQLPIHISEITIPAYTYEAEDERVQAELVYHLYRLWFSHPNMEAIIWWNLNDGSAYENEKQWKGGLLREDLSQKPAYQVLQKLINEEWVTNLTADNAKGNDISFHGYYGDYEITVLQDGKMTTHKLSLKKGSKNEYTVIL